MVVLVEQGLVPVVMHNILVPLVNLVPVLTVLAMGELVGQVFALLVPLIFTDPIAIVLVHARSMELAARV